MKSLFSPRANHVEWPLFGKRTSCHEVLLCAKIKLWLDIPFDSRRIIRTTKVIGVFGNFDSPIIQILKNPGDFISWLQLST
jgi:hypothetical protein